MARALAREFVHERERVESQKSNERPQETNAYIDFISRMSTRLVELADAIHAAFIKPDPDEPFFTPRVQQALTAVGTDFFDFLKENREKIYTIGLYGAAAAFFTALGIPAGDFLSGVLLGKTMARKK